MAHWKTLFDYKHLGCHDLPQDANGKPLDIVVTILSLEKREVITKSGKTEELPVADLKGAAKPMIFNKTNCETMANLFKTTEYKDFAGKTITLYAAKVKGKGGGIVDGLRIRETLPQVAAKIKKELNPDNPRFEGAKKSLKDGNVTMQQLKETFSISAENEKLLTA